MTNTYTYTAYGLTLSLPFPCPVLMPAPAVGARPDVVVAYGSVPRTLSKPLFSNDDWKNGFTWQAAPGCFLLRTGKRAARFLVEAGTKITIELNSEAEMSRVIHHFLHSVLAAVLRQRGLLVLHGNTAITARGAVVITGTSGAGKSTTLAALLERGCSMLADDVTALRQAGNGCIEALPGIPHLSLCDDAANGLGIDPDDFPRNPLRRAKSVIPVPDSMSQAPAPLRAIYFLKHSAGESLRIEPVAGTSKFAVLQEWVYGPLLPQEHPAIFSLLAAVAEQVNFFQVERSVNKWTVPELTEVILGG
ncbi:hypothetical protein SPSIL_026370 [Sporomusa silvacetica DSM 10669]|uniref:HPr kinase/phosphorylase n=1 Tax=Sporomusa silvacetica DSM 10669 TaxID=1123289 RepID=A0ABZ3ILD2_9FIRM|nr:hypothetical protein [Sporomusa silvacetica]OZC22986.1 HPr kinase/phosphorylase [Sporomusa silvacetica DSM 10669]